MNKSLKYFYFKTFKCTMNSNVMYYYT